MTPSKTQRCQITESEVGRMVWDEVGLVLGGGGGFTLYSMGSHWWILDWFLFTLKGYGELRFRRGKSQKLESAQSPKRDLKMPIGSTAQREWPASQLFGHKRNRIFYDFFWCRLFLKSLLNLLQYRSCFMVCLFFGQEACGILALQPWTESTSPILEGEVLTIGPLNKSLNRNFCHPG